MKRNNTRPILFSAPMIRALLAGTKTQTRRAMRLPMQLKRDFNNLLLVTAHMLDRPDDFPVPSREEIIHTGCPYGRPGDLLWVRESFAQHPQFADLAYRADDSGDGFEDSDGFAWEPSYKPSIHMPRALSRLTLRITDVRVQRLQDISDDDCRAEGVQWDASGWMDYLHADGRRKSSARQSFETLWQSINGIDSLAENPYVWALTFEVIKANVDKVLAP